jgi:two-component system chemotaxis response regulator CheB
VKRSGGITVIQDPADAVAPSMPSSAARHVEIDHKVPLSKLAPLLVQLSKGQPRAERRAMSDRLKIETDVAADEVANLDGITKIGDPSLFTCPECHGTLLKIKDEALVRFRCHTGHAFTAHSLLATLNESTEDAIWSAVRALQEGAMLLHHLAQHARDAGQEQEAKTLDLAAQAKSARANLIHKSLRSLPAADKVPAT